MAVPNTATTKSHYAIFQLAVVESVVLAFANEEFALGPAALKDRGRRGQWSRTISPDPNLIYESSPAVANGVVYVADVAPVIGLLVLVVRPLYHW